MAWRNCQASVTLVGELNAKYPRRDKSSDGTIGDAAHATRSSDHNPWVIVGGQGVVRARDVDKDGIPAADIVEYLRKLGAKGDPRLAGGGYLIFNRRITVPNFSGWKKYTGANPHDHHFHVSFSLSRAGFDSQAPWGISAGAAGTAAPTSPLDSNVLRKGMPQNEQVEELQRVLNRWYPSLHLIEDGLFGDATDAAVRMLQKNAGIGVDGEVGPATRKVLHL